MLLMRTGLDPNGPLGIGTVPYTVTAVRITDITAATRA
jgi:hypothetical protein